MSPVTVFLTLFNPAVLQGLVQASFLTLFKLLGQLIFHHLACSYWLDQLYMFFSAMELEVFKPVVYFQHSFFRLWLECLRPFFSKTFIEEFISLPLFLCIYQRF
jgi:hypothetical protein